MLLTQALPIISFLKGWAILTILLLPISLALTYFITVMGAANPSQPSSFKTLLTVLGFIYGLPLVGLIALLVLAKGTDFILQIIPLSQFAVSWLGIAIASILLVIFGNIFIDHLYQFKQGNYALSIVALFLIFGFAIAVYWAAKIHIPWIS